MFLRSVLGVGDLHVSILVLSCILILDHLGIVLSYLNITILDYSSIYIAV